MYAKLSQEVINTLCCPLCKGALLSSQNNNFVCGYCKSNFPLSVVAEDKIFDFRIHKPSYCAIGDFSKWSRVQDSWEDCYFERYSKTDELNEYSREISFIKEVYTNEFNIKGKVLDVGGGEGTLRHFLEPDNDKDSLYVNIDPTINVFANFKFRPNLLKFYPSLARPCNFLTGHAENLPFSANTFDWVHIRSALDHFQDPYLAVKEAYRVLKPGGSLLVGNTVYGGKSSAKSEGNLTSSIIYKIKIGGFKNFLNTAVKKVFKSKGWETIHTFEWQYENLIDLLHKANLKIIKEHWQKPPYTMVVWLQAQKNG